MGQFNYRMFLKLLCDRGITSEIDTYINEYVEKRYWTKRNTEGVAFVEHVVQKTKISEIEDPIYKAAVERFMQKNCKSADQEDCFKRMVEILNDINSLIGYEINSKKECFEDACVMLDEVYELHNPDELDYEGQAAEIINHCIEGALEKVPDNVIDYLFDSDLTDSWWRENFNIILDDEWEGGPGTAGGAWVLYWDGIYYKDHCDWGMEGPYEDGAEIRFCDYEFILKNGEAVAVEYDDEGFDD